MRGSFMKYYRMSPEEAVQFLEDFRILNQDKDESTQAISIRIPANILRLVKLKSKAENKKYQSVLIDYIRKGLKADL